jgi:hypothetical protein
MKFNIGIIYNRENMGEELCSVELKENTILSRPQLYRIIFDVWYPMIVDVLPEKVDVMEVLNEIGTIVGPGSTVELAINLAHHGMSRFGRTSDKPEECDTDVSLIFTNDKGIFKYKGDSNICPIQKFLFD